MSCNWSVKKLGDLVKFTSGGTPSKSNEAYWGGDIPWISASSMDSTRYSESELKVTTEGAKNGTRLVPKDTVLLLVRGGALHNKIPVGITTREVTFNQDVKALVPKTDEITPWYLLFWLISIKKTLLAKVENTGIGAGKLDTKILQELEVPLPPKPELQRLEKFCKALDDKIILNADTNQTLEQMAQAIFKSWFVDFDPVKAKMNGEQPEGMDAATASLFPEKLVESELGLIPEGWSVEEAKSQLDVLRGFSYKGKGLVGSLDEGVPMHNLNSVLEGGGYKYAGLKFYSEEFKEKFAIQEGDVLVANTEQGHNHLLIGYGAMVPKHLAHGFFSHHTYRVRPKKNSNMTPEFIERLFGKGRFVRQVQGFTNGTTVNMLPVAGMEMPQFVVPSKALAQKFSELVKPMKAMIEENHKSNIELAKLRDTLLPKLLSGEIELAEISKTIK
ncbi:restriction endonuclease subunit S [Vibrio parahaemolyticus]|uniref:restriction endonuclease subunit S n=1 Tax=Vibrio parahaemolyticus TaxID=670 RepID=UPI00146D4E99|nr:restriction endonuclease subunit S [Vibrio parahaemolyticus]MDF5022019.1 restriction endonuclease subunit S [Vibrio parahaemolyticus]MDF5040773.1 restriction endonuclease subunit S [Vibrio parahaemolyticus]MDF5157471.1 restriction endonuclease subunit S [Vibrio parahaemolyticus]MDF5161549.1 restriction endonuclease subunit S [Vibrio parahaemolyticus]MDF5170594.1 restriction endonuclease subunit S [Vibrio parahaemolyticus]